MKPFLILTVSLAVSIASCGASTHASATTLRPRVVAVGDSITRLSTYITTPALKAAGYRVSTFTAIGDVDQVLVPAIQRRAASHPQAMIVEAGVDDALWQIAGWRTGFDHIMAAVQHLRCVVFVTVPLNADYFGWVNSGRVGTVLTVGPDWNQALRDELVLHPNFRLVDWAAAVAGGGALLSPVDGIHPTAAGAAWLGDQYRAALATCS